MARDKKGYLFVVIKVLKFLKEFLIPRIRKQLQDKASYLLLIPQGFRISDPPPQQGDKNGYLFMVVKVFRISERAPICAGGISMIFHTRF